MDAVVAVLLNEVTKAGGDGRDCDEANIKRELGEGLC